MTVRCPGPGFAEDRLLPGRLVCRRVAACRQRCRRTIRHNIRLLAVRRAVIGPRGPRFRGGLVRFCIRFRHFRPLVGGSVIGPATGFHGCSRLGFIDRRLRAAGGFSGTVGVLAQGFRRRIRIITVGAVVAAYFREHRLRVEAQSQVTPAVARGAGRLGLPGAGIVPALAGPVSGTRVHGAWFPGPGRRGVRRVRFTGRRVPRVEVRLAPAGLAEEALEGLEGFRQGMVLLAAFPAFKPHDQAAMRCVSSSQPWSR